MVASSANGADFISAPHSAGESAPRIPPAPHHRARSRPAIWPVSTVHTPRAGPGLGQSRPRTSHPSWPRTWYDNGRRRVQRHVQHTGDLPPRLCRPRCAARRAAPPQPARRAPCRHPLPTCPPRAHLSPVTHTAGTARLTGRATMPKVGGRGSHRPSSSTSTPRHHALHAHAATARLASVGAPDTTPPDNSPLRHKSKECRSRLQCSISADPPA